MCENVSLIIITFMKKKKIINFSTFTIVEFLFRIKTNTNRKYRRIKKKRKNKMESLDT